jgi:hypothetical protein
MFDARIMVFPKEWTDLASSDLVTIITNIHVDGVNPGTRRSSQIALGAITSAIES